MDDEIYHFDSDQRIESISFGSNAMQVQRSLTLPAIPSADENDRKNKRRTFHSEERTIVKHPNPYLLKVWKSRWLSEKQEDKKLVFKVDYATPDVVRRWVVLIPRFTLWVFIWKSVKSSISVPKTQFPSDNAFQCSLSSWSRAGQLWLPINKTHCFQIIHLLFLIITRSKQL